MSAIEETVGQLPDEATLDVIQYRLYVRQKIEQGLADVAAGRVISHDEVKQRVQNWLSE